MEFEPAGRVVQRHLIDPRLDELDLHIPTFEFGRSPIRPIRLPRELLGLDTKALEDVALRAMRLLAATDEVASAG
jgi:hypothetical protein